MSRAVIDAQDHLPLCARRQSGTAGGTFRDALNVPANSRRLAHPQGLARQIAEREFDHCREIRGGGCGGLERAVVR